MIDTRTIVSSSTFADRLGRLDPHARLEEWLRLRDHLEIMARTKPDFVRHFIAHSLTSLLSDADTGIRISFDLLLAKLESNGGPRFENAVLAAEQAGLVGLAAFGCAEWARSLAAQAAWVPAAQVYVRAQELFGGLGKTDKSTELYPPLARVLTHLVDAETLDRRIGEWLCEPLLPKVALGLMLERAQLAIDRDRCAVSDRNIQAAHAHVSAASDPLGLVQVQVLRGRWYWRFGAYGRASEVFADAEPKLRAAGAEDEANLVAANLFSLRLMIDGDVVIPNDRRRFEQLRQSLRREDLAAWWQLSLDLAVGAERDGDLRAAARLYAELGAAPPPRPFELKLAGLNFARLRVANGVDEGLADDLAQARRDRFVLDSPYLRMLAFETSAMHAERHGRRPQASTLYRKASMALEQWRQCSSSEFLRMSLRGSRQRLYQRMESLSLGSGDLDSAFRTADSARAATFADVLGGQLAPIDRADLTQILRMRAKLGRALRAVDPDRETIARLEILLDRMIAEAPRSNRAGRTEEAGRSVLIKEHCAFLCYSVTARGLGGYLVRTGGITHCELLDSTECENLLGAVSRWWQLNLRDNSAEQEEEWQRDSAAWSAAVIEPFVDGLVGVDRLGVVPCGPLALLPWPGLWIESRQRYLDELFPGGVFVLPSIATGVLLATPAPEPQRGGALCVCAGEGLTYAPVEAALVAEALGPNLRQFSHPTVHPWRIRCQISSARWIHMAGHGEFRPDLPMGSSFLLGGGERWTGWDLATCSMPQSTVVLSSCTLGGIQDLPGGEWFGMARGFFLAGARRVIAPIWPVRDLLTLVSMSALYRSLAGTAGAELATRLRDARQTARGWGRTARNDARTAPDAVEPVLQPALAHWRHATVAGRHANSSQVEAYRAAMIGELCRLSHPRHWSVFQIYGDPGFDVFGPPCPPPQSS